MKKTPEEKRIKQIVGGVLGSTEFFRRLENKGIHNSGGASASIERTLKQEVKEGNLKLEDIDGRVEELIQVELEKQEEEFHLLPEKEKKKIEEKKAEKYIKVKELEKRILFNPDEDDSTIKSKIIQDMANLASHEAGTKWMRIGTLLSFDTTQQMIGAGFKAIIDQNKILVRQNELSYRQDRKLREQINNMEKQNKVIQDQNNVLINQNKIIIEELKKINQNIK